MRILIATVTAGGGHLAAASALEEAWHNLYPNDLVERIDLLDFVSPLQRKIFTRGYVKLAAKAPELWGMMFEKTDDPKVARRLNRLRQLFPGKSRFRLLRLLNQAGPDVVLCTHPLPFETLERIKSSVNHAERVGKFSGMSGIHKTASSQKTTPPFVASVVTDFEAHALWMSSCVDLYFVAAEETKSRLVARDASAENVVATGIPIAAKFKSRINAKTVRKNHGLRDDLPVLLVLSGGFGMGPVAEILAELDKVQKPFQMLVVCGRNEQLRRALALQDRKHPTQILGFTAQMAELMSVAELILTKPGGLTSSEALALGKPLFILNPILGQEAANSDFLLERGAAAKVNRMEDLPFRVEQLLGSRKLVEMARAAKALGRPRAAETICREVVKRLEQRGSK